MRIKWILIVSIVVLSSIVGLSLVNGLRDSDEQIKYNNDEIAWFEDQAIYDVDYFIDVEEVSIVKQVIQSLEINTGLEFVEISEKEIDTRTIIISDKAETYETYLSSRPILTKYAHHYKKAGYTNELDGMPVGVLEDQYNLISDIGNYDDLTLLAVNDIESLFDQYAKNLIDGFILIDEKPLLIDSNNDLYYCITTVPLLSETTKIYTHDSEATLASILSKAINYLVINEKIDMIVKNQYRQFQEEIFNDLLEEDERDLLNTIGKISVGVEEQPPWIIKKDNNLYGIVIAYFSHLEDLTGLEINYVIGERSKIKSQEKALALDALWLYDEETGYDHSTSIAEVSYVVVGLGSSHEIKTFNEMALERVGSVFTDHINSELTDMIPTENLTYYGTNAELVEDLLAGQIDIAVMTKADFDYNEIVLGISELDIRLFLEDTYNAYIYYPSDNDTLRSIMNKTAWVYSSDEYIEESLLGIPIEEDRKPFYWQLVTWAAIMILFVVLFFIGLYLLNKREKKQMNYLFTHDQITFLPNKYGLKQHIEASINRGDEGVILLIDIDNMKDINDRLGHLYGDQVIIEFAQVLMSTIDDDRLLGRSGGDEFVFAAKTTDQEVIMSLVNYIKELAKAYGNDKKELYEFTVSIASITYPERGEVFENLYRYLEYSIDYAKEKKGNNVYMEFSYEIYKNYLEEQSLVEEIKRGLENEEFILYIQPQINLSAHTLTGGEILVRWQHPEKGLVPPGIFLEIAEKNGLMRELDYYVLEKSFRMVTQWQKKFDYMKVSINMSTATFEDEAMVSKLDQLVSLTKVDTNWLTIEVTEDMGFENMEGANNRFMELRNRGFKVALDDFGKGYSSLSYLEKMTIDILKIDKAFIDNIHEADKSLEILRAIVQLAKIMEIDIVAEGVEYEEQAELLKEFEGIIAQGYFFSKPFSVDLFENYVSHY